jgi:hypothetical protein
LRVLRQVPFLLPGTNGASIAVRLTMDDDFGKYTPRFDLPELFPFAEE